ncbi:hypothetical protein ES703_04235 [subsurface metagenome]
MEILDYGPLLTVAAILVALLSIWSQGWARYTNGYTTSQTNPRIQISATLGTLWIYMAVVIAFISLGLLLLGKYWEGGGMDLASEVGFGFFITSFLMAFSNVVESTVTIFIRAFRGATISEAPRGIDPTSFGKPLLLKIIAIVVFSLLFSTLGVVCQHWWWIGLAPVWGYGLYIYIQLTRS